MNIRALFLEYLYCAVLHIFLPLGVRGYETQREHMSNDKPDNISPKIEEALKYEPIAYVNTDKEIWRKTKGDFYSPSIYLTKSGAIGINVGGYCIVKSIEEWHKLAIKRRGLHQ